jgi:glycolate oxidase
VDFSGWDQILDVDPANRLVRVQPGVVNHTLHQQLAEFGLFFPPNPGSWKMSTIGGNAATNASGPRSFRYGPTRHWVRVAEVVLGTGERVRVGHLARKRSAGPEILDALIGSEGTLGLFTELTLALAPRPEIRTGLVVPLPPEILPGKTAQFFLASRSVVLSAVEYIDRASARELGRRSGSRLPSERDLLLLELETDPEGEERALERILSLLREQGISEDPLVYPNADELWTLRGESSVALDQSIGQRVREDVAVPLDRLDELIREIRRLAERNGIPLYLFGHLGDGNLHPNFAMPPEGPRAASLRKELLETVHRLGGTISAEHGIGLLKAPFLSMEHGTRVADVLRGMKNLCDPLGILNPGKLFPVVAQTP